MKGAPELRGTHSCDGGAQRQSDDDGSRSADPHASRHESRGHQRSWRFTPVGGRERSHMAIDVDDDRLRRVLGVQRLDLSNVQNVLRG